MRSCDLGCLEITSERCRLSLSVVAAGGRVEMVGRFTLKCTKSRRTSIVQEVRRSRTLEVTGRTSKNVCHH